jgi:acetate kinase
VHPAGNCILTINGGSSSIKFALFATGGPPTLEWSGQIDRIGTAGAGMSFRLAGEPAAANVPVKAMDYPAAVAALMTWLGDHDAGRGQGRVAAIGHRIVHGGPKFHEATAVTAELVKELRRITPLDPEHLPEEILLIEAFARRFPRLPQFACFDTAFHHDLPTVARLLPIPRRYEAKGLRRYGFHGLSYEFLLDDLARVEGPPVAQGRVVLAHLGNGASLAAVHLGKPVDTSMGLTPAAGVPMGSRSGDIDPGLPGYLARTEGLDAAQFHALVNFKSGLLGISESSADMRDLLGEEARDPRAADAVALFCYQVRKCIGAFAAALGGLDTLVFAGGIGENAPAVRERICGGLDFLGIELDGRLNAAGARLISTANARVKVLVIRTNESLVIARAVLRLLGADPAGAGNPSATY